MKPCKHQKRLQIYLDGWMDKSEASKFERHLKKCPTCQAELVELEDVSSSALEIVDEAPERGYWDSFYSRIQNRITSRNITPYENKTETRGNFRLKMGTYSLAVISLAAVLLLALNLPSILNSNPDIGPGADILIEDDNPSAVANLEKENPSENLSSIVPDISDARIPASAVSEDTKPGSDDSPEKIEHAGEIVSEDEVPKTEVLSYFKDKIKIEKQEPKLTDPSLSNEPALTEFDKINEDYRLSGTMISAGILSEINNGGGLSSGSEERSVSTNGFGNWGYLSMPPDSGNAAEVRRYFIELELIQTK